MSSANGTNARKTLVRRLRGWKVYRSLRFRVEGLSFSLGQDAAEWRIKTAVVAEIVFLVVLASSKRSSTLILYPPRHEVAAMLQP